MEQISSDTQWNRHSGYVKKQQYITQPKTTLQDLHGEFGHRLLTNYVTTDAALNLSWDHGFERKRYLGG
jgi:hypothetical protein